MTARIRKLIGSAGVLVFLAAYVWAVTLVAERVPPHPAAQVLFYAVAGVLWGVPLLPLIRWMNAGD